MLTGCGMAQMERRGEERRAERRGRRAEQRGEMSREAQRGAEMSRRAAYFFSFRMHVLISHHIMTSRCVRPQ